MYVLSLRSGIVRNLSPYAAMNLVRPALAPLWSATFSFSKCHAEIKVCRISILTHIYM